MGNELIDLSKPIQPILFDPKKNEWILKERETRGIPWGDQKYLITPDVSETEYIKNGKHYYRRIEHHFDNRGKYDVVTEVVELPTTSSRLPGPTNGGLDLDDRTRWIITGSPLVQFRSKDISLHLEARLRIIFILAADKLDPKTTGQAIIDMLKDPVTIAFMVAALASWALVHFGSGPAVVIALIMDAVAAVIGLALLGKSLFEFASILMSFMELVLDAQSLEELNEAADLLVAMINILIIAAVQIALVVLCKKIFNGIKTKSEMKAGRAAEKIEPLELGQSKKPPLPRAPIGSIKATLIKNGQILEGLKRIWIESKPNDPLAGWREQGGFIVKGKDGSLSIKRWPQGKRSSIKTGDFVIREGKAFTPEGEEIAGSVHSHPTPLSHELTGAAAHPEPSLDDLDIARTIPGEHYVLSHGDIFTFDSSARCEPVATRKSILGL